MTDIRFSGPVFSGEAEAVLRRYVTDMTGQVAQEGRDMVEQILPGVLQHPTGYYQSHIQVERQASTSVVTDGGVVYGPWLEGVGSRNQTTRFKGYGTFRRAFQQLDGQAGKIADTVLKRGYLAELNGE